MIAETVEILKPCQKKQGTEKLFTFLILNIAITVGLMLIKQGQKHKFQIGNIAVNVAKKMGINFEKQKPADYRTDERNEQIKIKVEKMKEARKKNINSDIV